MAMALSVLPQGVILVDHDRRVSLINQAAAELLHIDAGQALGSSLEAFCALIGLEQPPLLGPVYCERGLWRVCIRALPLPPGAADSGMSACWHVAPPIEDIATRVCYEFRTPLTVIRGYAALLLGELPGPLTEDQRAIVQVIVERAIDLNSLINQTIIIADLLVGRLQVDLSAAAVSDLLEPMLRATQNLWGPRGIALTYTLPAAPLQVHTDDLHFGRLIAQILDNAGRYTRPGGSVTVTAEPHGSRVAIIVKDTGVGIPAEYQAALLKTFPPIPKPPGVAGGRGDGLRIAVALAERIDATLSIESSEGVGTTVVITVPAAG